MDTTSINGLKPERFYEMQEEVRIGNLIPGIVERYDYEERRVYVRITPDIMGFIQLDNFKYPPIITEDSMPQDLFPKEVKGYSQKKVIGRVIGIHEGGIVELDRRQILEDATSTIANNLVGTIVTATVEAIISYGIFVDIGNGVLSLIHDKECSKTKYYRMRNFFTVGQTIPKVKILGFDSKTKFFQTSIKQAYERNDPVPGSIVRVRVCTAGCLTGGRFVEFDPATTGIMDISPDEDSGLETGDYVWVSIKKIKPKGFCSKFIRKC